MRKSFLHRCFIVLGLLAMAGALLALPAMTFSAWAKVAHEATVGMDGGMPCDQPCPDCAKHCPTNYGDCLVKCFQPLLQPPLHGGLPVQPVAYVFKLPPSRVVTAANISPPTRPPRI